MPGASPDELVPRDDRGREGIPPLVLRCRALYLLLCGGAALIFLAWGTGALARGGDAGLAVALVLFLFGALAMQFFLRFCLARLELAEAGFRLRGPLHGTVEIGWRDVHAWRVRRPALGPALLRVEAADGRPITIPLLYEEAHLLELGLRQGGFPVW